VVASSTGRKRRRAPDIEFKVYRNPTPAQSCHSGVGAFPKAEKQSTRVGSANDRGQIFRFAVDSRSARLPFVLVNDPDELFPPPWRPARDNRVVIFLSSSPSPTTPLECRQAGVGVWGRDRRIPRRRPGWRAACSKACCVRAGAQPGRLRSRPPTCISPVRRASPTQTRRAS